MKTKKAFMTREGYDRLKKELDHLKSVRRKEVAQRISEAKDFGDISENSEYEEAKNEQAFMEGRIAELEKILKVAQIKDKCENNLHVEVGCQVILQDHGQEEVYSIVGSAETDPGAGKISIESPIGNALMGRSVGEKVFVRTPSGEVEYTIKEIRS